MVRASCFSYFFSLSRSMSFRWLGHFQHACPFPLLLTPSLMKSYGTESFAVFCFVSLWVGCNKSTALPYFIVFSGGFYSEAATQPFMLWSVIYSFMQVICRALHFSPGPTWLGRTLSRYRKWPPFQCSRAFLLSPLRKGVCVEALHKKGVTTPCMSSISLTKGSKSHLNILELVKK